MDVRKQISDADYVIVGIGEGFGYDWSVLDGDDRYVELFNQITQVDGLDWLIPHLQKVTLDYNTDNKLAGAYQALKELIENKDYYVVTTTIDDYVYNAGLNADRIVTPCGGFRQLQCSQNCHKELINLPNALLKYVQNLYNNKMSLDEMMDKYPECPHCGSNLIYNQIGADNYLEDGYLIKWTAYREWLEKTMNRKTVLLELGVGLGFMSVIRSPFERLVGYNLKSMMYRVHPTLSMAAANTGDRCVSVPADPMEWITSI